MSRRLICSLLAALITGAWSAAPSPLLQRFLTLPDPSLDAFRARRHLEARNEHFDSSASMDVVTDADAAGFRYTVEHESGSPYIREHVFRATLEGEAGLWASPGAARGALTPANYTFEDCAAGDDGLSRLLLKPRRKDMLLVDGSIFLNPENGDLVRLEGRLSKTPSFWTRRVEIVRSFRRLAGVRVPVSLESVATLLVAGRSTFRMTYDYESVNGRRIAEEGRRAQAGSVEVR